MRKSAITAASQPPQGGVLPPRTRSTPSRSSTGSVWHRPRSSSACAAVPAGRILRNLNLGGLKLRHEHQLASSRVKTRRFRAGWQGGIMSQQVDRDQFGASMRPRWQRLREARRHAVPFSIFWVGRAGGVSAKLRWPDSGVAANMRMLRCQTAGGSRSGLFRSALTAFAAEFQVNAALADLAHALKPIAPRMPAARGVATGALRCAGGCHAGSDAHEFRAPAHKAPAVEGTYT